MPADVNEVLGFILAVGLLLWLGAAPIIALRTLFAKNTPKPKPKPKPKKKAKAPLPDKISTENVIDTYGKKYTLTEVDW